MEKGGERIMSLQFVFGNAGSGKSYYLQKEILQESMKFPEENYIFLVPEQFTLQTQKDIVSMHEKKGIMNIDVLSFLRLAYRIFDEVGESPKSVLDETGKNLIIREVVTGLEEELQLLKKTVYRIGYIGEIKSLLSEFVQYDVQISDLEKLIEAQEADSYLKMKLCDLKKIYEAFQKRIAEKYVTNEEIPDILCSVIGESKFLKGSIVVLDEFTGFTPVQIRVIGELLKVCKKVIISVVMDKREDPYILRHKYQMFALGKETVTRLYKLAASIRTEIEEPKCLYANPVYRFRGNETMAFFEENLFRISKKKYKKEQETISVSAEQSPKEEILRVAMQIKKSIYEKGYRYKDIALIVPDMQIYAPYIGQIFKRYEIPVFMDYKRSVLLNSFVEYTRSALDLVNKNFSYESVFRFLKTGLLSFESEEIEILENYVIAFGIRGYGAWSEPFMGRRSSMKEEDLQKINEIRERFIEQIKDFALVLKKKKKTVKEISVALYQFFVTNTMQEILLSYEEKFIQIGEGVLAKEYAQIYQVVIELLEKFVELFGEETLSLKEYCEFFDAGLEDTKIGVLPPSIDEVVVGDVERTRLKDIKILFLVGANENFFPGKKTQGGMLSEADREKFQEKEMILAPGIREQLYIQKFYLYSLLTKPKDLLNISYSKVSADGKSQRPSYLITEVRSIFPGLKVEGQSENAVIEAFFSEKTAIYQLAKGMRNGQDMQQSKWQELYSWYVKKEQWNHTLTQMRNAAFGAKLYTHMTEKSAEELYANLYSSSVTRLEYFSRCAFAHFMRYGLALKERDEYDFKVIDMGNIFHGILEKFAVKAAAFGKDSWEELSEEETEYLIEESMQESIEEYESDVIFSTARNQYMLNRIRRLVKRSIWAMKKQLARGRFWPSDFEVNFGSGKIDRIDTYEAGNRVYVKVTDYKTGAQEFDMAAFYYGLQMQLVIYLEEAMRLEQKKHKGKEIVPAGIFYYQVKDPIVERQKKETDIEKAIMRKLVPNGLVNEQEEILEYLDQEPTSEVSVLPVRITKSGKPAKANNILTQEEFQVMTEYAKHLREDITSSIKKGNIEVNPYLMKGKTGCEYCNYKEICKFDPELHEEAYRELFPYKKEDLIAKMRYEKEQKEKESWE